MSDVRLCCTCACSNTYQAMRKVGGKRGQLRIDKRCWGCGEFNWTLRYARPDPHHWFTFWSVFLGTFGLCWLLYLLYLYWMAICQPFVVEYLKQWN